MTASFFGLRHPCILLLFTLALFCPFRAVQASDNGSQSSPLLEGKTLSSEDLSRINNSARGLAGMNSEGGADWQSTSEWASYQKWLDERWRYLDRVRLNAMRNWGDSELSGLRSASPRAVFYPFSGPDILYADTLFPNSKYLVMAGLEPVGTMPDLAKLEQNGRLGDYLTQVKTSLFTILAASFFKTKDMKNDFNNQLVDGLMPAMAVFLARQGYTIDNLQYVTLDHDGIVHSRGERSGSPGVQITYFKGDRGDLRTVLYFETNIANDGLEANPGYIRLMQRLGPGVTYLKAASYLLYDDYFSTIRNAILDDSIGVVEDDSGVPFHYFKPEQWDVIPYGNYTGPIPLFKEHYQPDLAAYYSKTTHSPLSFGSGYKFTASISSLLVAKKK
jgi:hypothetical protein